MANIPTPDVAKGTAVGAKQGRSAGEFHDGPLIDIRDHGAAMDGSTDDSGAIMDALRKSASGSGAAYIPKGTAFVDGWRAVDVRESMNGATLVGEGADSVIKGNSLPIGFFQDDHRDVMLANFRIDASNASRGINSPNSGAGISNLVFKNLWVHGASGANISLDAVNGSGLVVKMENMSTWGATKWHGITSDAQGGRVELRNILSWGNGVGDNKYGGLGVDCSGTEVYLNGFICTNNHYGVKTTGDTVRTEIRNGVLIGNREMGFYSSGQNSSAEVVIDNVLSKNNGWEGFSFRASNYTVPSTIWAIDNCVTGGGSASAGVEYAYGCSLDVAEMQVCGTQNGYPGVTDATNDCSGSVSTLFADANDGGTFGSSGDVSYSTVENRSPSIPSIEEIVGSATQSTAPSVKYHDGSGWQDAEMRYYDGSQFTDVSVNRIG